MAAKSIQVSQPRDRIGSAPYAHYHAEYNAGARNTICTGGGQTSNLLPPIIPPQQ